MLIILCTWALCGLAGCGQTGGPDAHSPSETEVAHALAMRGEHKDIEISDVGVTFDYARKTGSAAYALYNGGEEPVAAALAFSYEGGLYAPDLYHIEHEDATVSYTPVFGRATGGAAAADSVAAADSAAPPAYIAERFDGQADHTLYTISVTRGQGYWGKVEELYIGADFVVDASKTRIIADGFGYAANPYGAVRIWSLSDGFDTGMGRRLFVLGDDIDLDVRAYEDADLTVASGAAHIEVSRETLSARDYLLMFSAPMALSAVGGRQGAQGGQAYADALYSAYAEALDSMLEIHYFIGRGELYARAEERRQNALLFEISLPAKAGGTLEISFPIW